MITNGRYYYLVSSLPQLSLQDRELTRDTEQLKSELESMLEPGDMELIRVLYIPFDIAGLAAACSGTPMPFKVTGNHSEEDLQEALYYPELLPDFLAEAIDGISADGDQNREYHHIHRRLTAAFMDWVRGHTNPLLRKWFSFDHHLRNILAGLNSRKFSTPIHEAVIGDDFEASNIMKSKDRYFGLLTVVEDVERMIAYFDEQDLMLRETSYDELRWAYLEELEAPYHFSIENLMVYTLKTGLVQRHVDNNNVAGTLPLERLLGDIVQEHQLPASIN